MPFKKIVENLYLGDQFSNQLGAESWELKISNIYYDLLNQQPALVKNDFFVLTKDKLAIKMYDTHDVNDFYDSLFAVATKFISQNVKQHQIYTHCQLGVSRSASTIFVYLVVNGDIPETNFHDALKIFVTQFYPYMKVNWGIYQYLKTNFPFKKVQELMQKDWGEF